MDPREAQTSEALPPEVSAAADRRTEQRTALGTLLHLADSCARIEQDLEKDRSDVQRRTQREFAQAESMLKARYDKLRTTVADRRKQELAVVDRKFKKDAGVLEGEADATRTSLKRKYGKSRQKLDREHQDAKWLAESVRDADTNRAVETFTELDENLSDLEKQTAEATDAAAELADLYGRAMPRPPEVTPTGTAADAAEMTTAALRTLQSAKLPKLFVGAMPFILGFLLLVIAAAVAQVLHVGTDAGFEPLIRTAPDPVFMGSIVGGTLVVLIAAGLVLKRLSGQRFDGGLAEFAEKAALTNTAADAERTAAAEVRDAAKRKADTAFKAELDSLESDFAPKRLAINARHTEARRSADNEHKLRLDKLKAERQSGHDEINGRWDAKLAEIDTTHDGDLAPVVAKRDAILGESGGSYTAGRAKLEQDWAEALAITQTMAAESDAPEFAAIEDWRSWRPSTTFSPTVRFGQMRVDLRSDEASESLPMPEPYDVPALLAFPQHANLLLKHEPAGRAAAIDTLRLVMLRLLTALPPGRVQFTLIDPVSLGESFAGFMHLADDDDALVGGRVWTDADQIDRQLTDLTEHMETVIQKYLRNAFATIDDYNEQAGELAEPYRFLVIADLPTNFSEASLRRLSSIMSSGPRCGVHVVAALDVRQPWQASTTLLEDLENGSTTLLFDDEEQHFVWDDDVFGRFPLTLDSPPDDAQLTDVLRVIGKAAKDAKRVEVPFTTITPETLWTGNSAQDISVPVGRSGATRIQQFRFGRGVAQHALIAGKTGSGKSTLLNALICNLALHYPPDQLALYLIDFKRGVEFKTYATHKLPHARAVAVESDREFGLSVLQRLDEEIARRGDLFRDAGVQDLAAFRQAKPDVEMPRVLLVVDEFQELFSDDDKLAQDAALLIDRLVRQGRAFGMHVVLGSQTIAGGAGLARSTLGQIAIRVALQTTENDSRLILGEDNTAARLLTRPGEAIYNDAGGAIEGNSPFQVAWLPDAERDTILQRVTDRATDEPERELAIFEGNAPADLADNLELKTDAVRRSVAYLGEAVAIRPPTHFPFRRQVGSHLLMVGQQDESVTALVASSLVSLHHTSSGARLLVGDGTPTDAALHGLIRNVAGTVGADAEFADYRALPDVLADAAQAVRDRADGDAAPPLFVVIHQLQRFRDLAKHDEFGSSSAFSSMLGDDQPAQADPPGKLLLEILRDGPPVGVHVIATVDTYASLERRLGREALREFDGRVLFQMSANDSSVLIDTPAANRLGFYRALLCSEERGTQEKFRPYAVPDPARLPHAGKSS